MKLISWNVNGLRAVMKKGFKEFAEKQEADILCLQETKIDHSLTNFQLDDYQHVYWNCADKKGYSGTAIFTKIKPIHVSYGMNMEHHDKEGRIITAEYDEFYLVNVYTPNSQRGLTRLTYRQEWNKDFLIFIKKLEKKKPVIVCGDLNVAHNEIDIANPKGNRKNAGFTDEERRDFTSLLDAGYLDTFRTLYPSMVKYSWWTYLFNARAKNVGWRIDYFVISQVLKKQLKDAQILNEVMGSDHCPVTLELRF
jgi:exodeoxyribonuclease-3